MSKEYSIYIRSKTFGERWRCCEHPEVSVWSFSHWCRMRYCRQEPGRQYYRNYGYCWATVMYLWDELSGVRVWTPVLGFAFFSNAVWLKKGITHFTAQLTFFATIVDIQVTSRCVAVFTSGIWRRQMWVFVTLYRLDVFATQPVMFIDELFEILYRYNFFQG